MKKYKWQLLIIFLCLGIVGLLFLNRNKTTPSDPNNSSVATRSASYSEALIGNLSRLNPVLDYGNSVDRDVDRLIFSRLITFDALGQPTPELATVWGITIDGLTYTVQIHPDVKWHDGEKLTTKDVEFTVKLIQAGGEGIPADLQKFWSGIEVTSLNETTIQFVLPEPYAPFLDYLSFGILPEHILAGLTPEEFRNSNFNIQPVGSGPFKFDSLITKDEKITGIKLARNDQFYSQLPNLESVTFMYYPDSSAAMNAYRNGVVQGISKIDSAALPQALEETKLNMYTSRLPRLSMVMFNLKTTDFQFLQDPIVRAALYGAINKQYIIDKIWNGQVISADGPIFPGTWAYMGNPYPIPYSVETSIRKLTEAKYPMAEDGSPIRMDKNGNPMEFSLLFPDTPQHKLVAEEIQRDWDELGIKIRLVGVTYDDLINNRLKNRDFQAALVDLDLSNYPDPDPYPFWDSVQATDGQNYSQWDQKVASEYLEEARVTVRLDERVKFYRNFQVIFAEELPALPLYYPVTTYAVDEYIRGIRIGPLMSSSDRFGNIIEWYTADQTPRPTATPTP